MNHQDPLDDRNGSLVINADNVGGSIDPNVATFEDSATATAISLKRPVTVFSGMDVSNGLDVDLLTVTQINTQLFNSTGLQVAGNGSVFGTFQAGDVNSPGVITAARLTATGDLPSSYSSAWGLFWFGSQCWLRELCVEFRKCEQNGPAGYDIRGRSFRVCLPSLGPWEQQI